MPTGPSPIRTALNRVTFGALDSDVAKAESMGWTNWVEDQLNPPASDEPALYMQLASATLKISYAARDEANGTWPAVNEERPLETLFMDSAQLMEIYNKVQRDRTLPGAEINRIADETVAATWIRNTHSTYQVREFLTDFWHRHFNVATSEGQQVMFTLPVYDREVMRANAFGNFRALTEATAKATAMLYYLDNADSRASIPNENYAREMLELHTLGADNYIGVSASPVGVSASSANASAGFTDADIVQASRALSGWTVGLGQRVNGRRALPRTGAFIYEPDFHNTNAGIFMGGNLADLQGVAQGEKVIETAAEHELAGHFIARKLAKRIFGDTPPANVVEAAATTWNANRKSANQIRDVVRTILLSDEIMQGPAVKMRRPYEKMIAFARAIGATIAPHRAMFNMFSGTRDTVFSWPAPNGWPDVSGYWLSTTGVMTQWNTVASAMSNGPLGISVTNESIATSSISTLVDDWIQRIVGFDIAPASRAALIDYASGNNGIKSYVGQGKASAATIEANLRRLVALISTTPEFTYR